MVVKRSKSFIGWSLLGLLLCTAAGTMLARYEKMTGCYDHRPSLKGFDVTIDVNQSQQLIERSREFADKHGFEFDLAYVTPSGKFRIDMIRKDVEVIIVSPFELGKFRIGFYNNDCLQPTVASDIGGLVTDLKSHISEIPNAILTEQRKSLRITLDVSQREEFFAQMRKLADEHSLEFTISFSSDKTLFNLEIHGEGLHITSEPVVGSPEEISIVFFIDYLKAPTAASLETVEELSNELKGSLDEILNVTITEEK